MKRLVTITIVAASLSAAHAAQADDYLKIPTIEGESQGATSGNVETEFKVEKGTK